jgi:DNA-binding response OmpR family regulator
MSGEELSRLDPLWRARWQLRRAAPYLRTAFTVQERRLISALVSGPHTLSRLLRRVYGEGIDLGLERNRLHSVIKRLRRKIPGVIQFSKGLYAFR